jgi:hypothetical protein
LETQGLEEEWSTDILSNTLNLSVALKGTSGLDRPPVHVAREGSISPRDNNAGGNKKG